MNTYGSFTVNLGVFIAEVHQAMTSWSIGRVIQEYDCEIRKRLGELLPDPRQEGWKLDMSASDLAQLMTELLEQHGMPFLDGLSSRDAIIGEWGHLGNEIELPPRGQLSIAVIHARQGRVTEARRLARTHYAEVLVHPRILGQYEFVERVAADLGFPLP